MFKVTVDNDLIENVADWRIDGNVLVLSMQDGSYQGLTGFVEFTIERVNPNDKF